MFILSFVLPRLLVLTVVGLVLSPLSLVAQKKLSRPNVIFILADDLGYGDLSMNGQKHFQTPHIDQLAKQGMTFKQFYAGATVCAPSRSALMTGQHTGHTYIRGNKELYPEGQVPLVTTAFTMAEMFQKAGYVTGAFGKWGLGMTGSEGAPNRQGFNTFYGYVCQRLAHRYYPSHLWDNEQKIELEGNGPLMHKKEFAPDMIQERVLSFIDAHANQKEPFFLYVPSVLPHAELLVPNDSIFQSFVGRFEEKPFKGDDYGIGATDAGYASQEYPRAAFAAMVTRLDIHVGQIMAKLKEKGIDENTLIVFTSDNGPHQEGGADPNFFKSAAGLRGYKRDLYEGGIRVPFIVRWPNGVSAGKESQFVGAFWDVMPTFAELAGVRLSEPLDGISFKNTLLGKKKQPQHDYLYWEFHELGGRQAIRKGHFKAVRLGIFENPNAPIELYDLHLDPFERKNVAHQHPTLIREFQTLMRKARTESELFPFEL